MPPIVLTVLKIVFLGLLYVFVARAMRAAAVQVRSPGSATPPARVASQPRSRQRGDKPPKELILLDESGKKVSTVPLDGNLQIGRADACQIRLEDTYASAFHARIFRREDGWFVEDLGSTNGTYLNNHRVTSPAELRPGDRLRVGKSTMELRR